MKSAEVEITVEFFDVDSMGIVWNGRYFDYFEVARHRLFDLIGLPYKAIADEGYMLPLTSNRAKYIRPLRLGQKVIVKATVSEYDLLLKIRFEIRDKESGIITTKGESTQMAVDIEGRSLGDIPAILKNAIKENLDV
ncbi:MAG: acyl-CoA thioesterase [Spirochaetales bacterium]|nr:acyl-CoA thioesterase [Spirochaetales bacterium]